MENSTDDKEPFPSLKDVTVSELKRILDKRGIPHKMVKKKKELYDLVLYGHLGAQDKYSIDSLTIADIKGMLDDFKIEYKRSMKKRELYELLQPSLHKKIPVKLILKEDLDEMCDILGVSCDTGTYSVKLKRLNEKCKHDNYRFKISKEIPQVLPPLRPLELSESKIYSLTDLRSMIMCIDPQFVFPKAVNRKEIISVINECYKDHFTFKRITGSTIVNSKDLEIPDQKKVLEPQIYFGNRRYYKGYLFSDITKDKFNQDQLKTLLKLPKSKIPKNILELIQNQ